MNYSLWSIVDGESDLEVGTVSYDGTTLRPTVSDPDLEDLIDSLDIVDPAEFPDKLALASKGRYIAIPEEVLDDEDVLASYTVEEGERKGGKEEPEGPPVEEGWVASVLSESGKPLGRIIGTNAGKLELDITDASLQALMMLDVVPALEEVSMTPATQGYSEALKKAIESLKDKDGKERRYRVELREVLSVREAGGDTPNAVVRWGSTSPQWSGPAAPWSSVPLFPARDYIKRHPGAKIEINFPTVFEEDRSAKIKDIVQGDEAGYVSHRRSAEQYAKEMGFEQFDYDDEQAEISMEHPKAAIPPGLEKTGQQGGITIGGGTRFQQPQAEMETPGGGRSRAEWATDDAAGRHGFRAEQKRLSELEEAVKELQRDNANLRESLTRQLREVSVPVQAGDVHVHTTIPERETKVEVAAPVIQNTVEAAKAPDVHIDAPVTVNIPEQKAPDVRVEVHPPEHKLTEKSVEYDAEGKIKRIKETVTPAE